MQIGIQKTNNFSVLFYVKKPQKQPTANLFKRDCIVPKYYRTLDQETHLSHKTGNSLVVSPNFLILSSTILSRCIFMQNLIQQIIYISHGKELIGAKKTLKKFPNPKARVDFLCSFPYSDDDPVVFKVFNFARELFSEIYELRNILAHEVWSSSDNHPNLVLFSSLDENARIQMASSRLWHVEEMTSKETYESTIRFIRSVKIVSEENLLLAFANADLCNLCFINIINILSETDPLRKDEARKPLFVYNGTSHLFGKSHQPSGFVEFKASRGKTINQ